MMTIWLQSRLIRAHSRGFRDPNGLGRISKFKLNAPHEMESILLLFVHSLVRRVVSDTAPQQPRCDARLILYSCGLGRTLNHNNNTQNSDHRPIRNQAHVSRLGRRRLERARINVATNCAARECCCRVASSSARLKRMRCFAVDVGRGTEDIGCMVKNRAAAVRPE